MYQTGMGQDKVLRLNECTLSITTKQNGIKIIKPTDPMFDEICKRARITELLGGFK